MWTKDIYTFATPVHFTEAPNDRVDEFLPSEMNPVPESHEGTSQGFCFRCE